MSNPDQTSEDHRKPRRQRAREAATRPLQLSDTDGVFLSVDSARAPSCISGLSIVEAESSSRFSFDRYVDVLTARFALIERFRWKLADVPLGLDNAYWVEAEDFDPADHVHRIAVPSPGDRAALAEVIGFLHGLPLDRSRPLWECWWIEGLEGGRVATLLKFHHCLMDGASGMGLTQILFDLSPAGADVPPAPQAPAAGPARLRAPSVGEVAFRALGNAIRRPRKIAAHTRLAARAGIRRLVDPSVSGRVAPPVPASPFNDRLSGERAFAFASLPVGPLREVRKHFDVKMNDLLLALLSSSLRSTLQSEGALPDLPLVAVCPVSVRSPDDPDHGNHLSSMSVGLATDREDPIERLTEIGRSSRAAKQRLEDGEFEFMAAFGDCFVPGALKLATGAAHVLSKRLPIPGNLVFSNVRGLDVPLYLAGARVSEIYPLSMLQVATGMNVTAVSHDDQVDFGFLVDRALVPNPWRYADALEEGLETLLRAVDARVAASPQTAPPAFARPPLAVPDAETAADRAETTLEVEPIDLVQIMAGLAHVRAPARGPIGVPVGEDGRPVG